MEQRGRYSKGMKLADMRKELGSHPDFLHGHGHAGLFIPKYHCELNSIERGWARAKRYTRAYCNYITGLRTALDSVSNEWLHYIGPL